MYIVMNFGTSERSSKHYGKRFAKSTVKLGIDLTLRAGNVDYALARFRFHWLV